MRTDSCEIPPHLTKKSLAGRHSSRYEAGSEIDRQIQQSPA